MLKKILKWTGILVGSLALLLAAFYAYIYFSIESRANKVYEVKVQKLSIPTDSTSIAIGEHIAVNRGCKGCHFDDLAGGRAFADDESPIGILYSSNITSGKGGISYSNEDWIRALRHGLGKDSKPLWFMPSHELYQLSNQDIANLLSYVKSRPPVDKETREKSLKPLGRILTFFDQFPLFSAEKIDHNATYVDEVKPTVTPEYGKYLAVTCTGCHAENFKGSAPHQPGQPPIPDISATGNVGKWSAENFTALFKTGVRPDGKSLNPAMPWKDFNYTQDELNAIYSYLHGLR